MKSKLSQAISSKQAVKLQKHLGFTLIELLVVITIIAILAGAAFPVVNGVMAKARKVRVLAVVKDLQVAIKSYQTEYNRYPAPAGGGDTTITTADVNLISVLLGQAGGAGVSNPREIRFLELPIARNNKGGLVGTGIGAQTLVDEWGTTGATTGNPYTIIMDSNYDNQITIPGAGAAQPIGVAVYSFGPDGVEFTRDDVTSW